MKKIFTLCLCIMQAVVLLAATPTVPASNFIFSNIDGNKFTIKFTAGNGTNRIVVMKAGSAITGNPANGTDYTANTIFGTANTAFTAAGEYVVYKGSGTTVNVTNLAPHTTYHIAVYEYNVTGTATEYLNTALTGSQPTATYPTTQVSNFTATNIIGNSIKLNWTNGNGDGRLILARKGAAVNGVPQDLTDYTASTDFGDGSVINGDNYVVFKTSGNTVTLAQLEPNTTYHFAFFEKNGQSAPLYLKPAVVTSATTLAGPTIATRGFSYSSQEGNRISINASPGNGSRRLFIIKKASAVTAVPQNGTTYTANPAFGSGQQINAGEYVVNASTDAFVTVTNLEPATTYHIRSYEYDVDASGNTYYLTSSYAVSSFSTASMPSQVTNINFTGVTGNAMTIRYTAGNGGYRMVIMKESAPVDVTPADLTRYTGNGAFGTGTQIGTGNYVVNGGANGTLTAVTNLKPGFTYHVAVFEFSGNNYPVYAVPAATASITMPAEPTTASTVLTKSLIEGNSMRLSWTNGDGSRRIVVARKASAVSVTPVDGTTYTANMNFGSGTALSAGQFVVYDGTAASCDVKNLEIGSTYHFAVFEYNLQAASPDYLVSSFLAGNGATYAAPSQQVSALAPVTILANSVTLGFTAGNGNGRMFIMREGSAVDTDPIDLTAYSSSSVFGNAEIGTGNHIVHRTTVTGNFTVTGLQPSTQYYVAAYDYNGVNNPVYSRPAFTINFTTAAGSGVTAPTVASSAPAFSSIEGNKVTFNWTAGNGANRIVVARQSSAVSFSPANSSTYAANASMGSGTDLGSGQYVVFNGSASSVMVTNLQPATTYHFTVYEYNGTGANTRYLTATNLTTSITTAAAPTTGTTSPVATMNANTLTLSWANGNGAARLVVMKEGSNIASTPANLSVYPANTNFGSGSQIGTGEFVVYAGNSNTVNVAGLSGSKTYYYKIFEYNGSAAPVYNTSTVASGNITTAAGLPVSWLYVSAQEKDDKVLLKWGTAAEVGNRYFVVERNSSAAGYVSLDTVYAQTGGGANKHYIFTDATASAGINLYRLKQVDKDGAFSYSSITSVKKASQSGFSFYPNPAMGSIKIQLTQGLNATILIYDSKGSLVHKQTVQHNSIVDVTKLQRGVYHVVVDNGQTNTTRQLIRL